MEVVSQLDIESLVNSAQCPTRVESSVATKNQGLRVGYKWLVKSVIANYLDLGERVARDIHAEKLAEKARREEIKRRIEERRKKEEETDGGDGGGGGGGGGVSVPNGGPGSELFDPPGFVPVETLRARWAAEDHTESSPEVNSGDSEQVSGQVSSQVSASPALSLEPLNVRSLGGRLELELEPISGPKKKGLLSKLNKLNGGQNCSEVRSLDSRISGDPESEGERRGAHTGYRNWGLAEELEPTAA